MTLDVFFAGWEESRRLFEAVRSAVDELGPVQLRVGKSQVAFSRRRAFAWAWIPGRYLRGAHAPLVLTVSLHRRDASKRWKRVVEPVPGRFTHHLELRTFADIDDEVRAWLREAWESADRRQLGTPRPDAEAGRRDVPLPFFSPHASIGEPVDGKGHANG